MLISDVQQNDSVMHMCTFFFMFLPLLFIPVLPRRLSGKESGCHARDSGLIPGSR